MRTATLLLLAGLLSLGAGCGPIRSTMGLVDAEKALREAHDAGSVEKAPYQTAMAEELLERAHEASGRSTYDASMHLAGESAAWSLKAKDIARGLVSTEPPAPEPLPNLEPPEPEPSTEEEPGDVATPSEAASEPVAGEPEPDPTPAPKNEDAGE